MTNFSEEFYPVNNLNLDGVLIPVNPLNENVVEDNQKTFDPVYGLSPNEQKQVEIACRAQFISEQNNMFLMRECIRARNKAQPQDPASTVEFYWDLVESSVGLRAIIQFHNTGYLVTIYDLSHPRNDDWNWIKENAVLITETIPFCDLLQKRLHMMFLTAADIREVEQEKAFKKEIETVRALQRDGKTITEFNADTRVSWDEPQE